MGFRDTPVGKIVTQIPAVHHAVHYLHRARIHEAILTDFKKRIAIAKEQGVLYTIEGGWPYPLPNPLDLHFTVQFPDKSTQRFISPRSAATKILTAWHTSRTIRAWRPS